MYIARERMYIVQTTYKHMWTHVPQHIRSLYRAMNKQAKTTATTTIKIATLFKQQQQQQQRWLWQRHTHKSTAWVLKRSHSLSLHASQWYQVMRFFPQNQQREREKNTDACMFWTVQTDKILTHAYALVKCLWRWLRQHDQEIYAHYAGRVKILLAGDSIVYCRFFGKAYSTSSFSTWNYT